MIEKFIDNIYRVSQEERTKLREGVPYVKLYRYNPKHLYPKLNAYGDNGQRKCGHLEFPRTVRLQLCSALTFREQCGTHFCDCTSSAQCDKIALLPICTVLGNPKDNRDMSGSVFVVQFNGFMSLTSYFDVKYRY